MSDSTPTGVLVASRYGGEVIETYFPRADGDCDLLWLFDGVGLPEDKPRKYLRVHLTEEEARKVFERRRTEDGILEPIRAQMTHRHASIFQDIFEGGGSRGVGDFEVPSDGSERDFLEALDSARVRTKDELEQKERLRRAELQEMERELDAGFAKLPLGHRVLNVGTYIRLRGRIRRLRREVEATIHEEESLDLKMQIAAGPLTHALI